MIYAVDFDGTLCEDRFPEIGREIPERVNYLKALQKQGHKLILWTCRQDCPLGQYLTRAINWCNSRGLYFDAVNENLKEVQEKWGGDTRKVFCDFYIDDKNLLPIILDHSKTP